MIQFDETHRAVYRVKGFASRGS